MLATVASMPEVILVVAVAALCLLAIALLMSSKRPDPKMELLVDLLQRLPQ